MRSREPGNAAVDDSNVAADGAAKPLYGTLSAAWEPRSSRTMTETERSTASLDSGLAAAAAGTKPARRSEPHPARRKRALQPEKRPVAVAQGFRTTPQ